MLKLEIHGTLQNLTAVLQVRSLVRGATCQHFIDSCIFTLIARFSLDEVQICPEHRRREICNCFLFI